ncbi:MAG: aspartate--ammonia ligase [Clostridiaceae bacterium]|nr:aspartate--ammonia ligase [Clostridiaceae bacterium]
MSTTIIPEGYHSALTLYETQLAIGMLKNIFALKLSAALNLKRVSAPLFVDPSTGLNDDLNGVERPVSFDIAETGKVAVVVHSLAKWKRMALHKYHFPVGEGLYTDMNAIRRDEVMDNLHSVYVDQWDWERVIDRSTRNVEFLKDIVTAIVGAICDTQDALKAEFPALNGKNAPAALTRDITFVTTQELEDLYPDASPKERENLFIETHPTCFIMQIGGKLRSGIRHDGRAPDYDDWTLNGDIVFRSDLLGGAFEVSSMGIRVDAASLDAQLREAGCDDRRALPFHKALLSDELPLSIGGGIGQSRLSMLLLGKAHIGEVQVSVWDDATVSDCAAAGVELL